MFRNLSAISKNSPNMRRRQQTRQEQSIHRFAPYDCTSTGLDGLGANLDLSIHQAGSSSSNRFAGLTSLPPAHLRDREFAVSSPRRRSRTSRGSKEAKRRRDARRNKRKFAAHLLDEQFSQDLDETLTRANIPPLARVPSSTHFSFAPLALFSQPWPATTWTPVPPTPPQLPSFNFSDLHLNDFPYLTAARSAFTAPLTPPPETKISAVPRWCPPIPSLVSDGQWDGNLPRFTDLSGLIERNIPSPSPGMQQLQTWTMPPKMQKRERSRFFASTRLTPTVSCRLHRSETLSQDPKTTAWGVWREDSNSPSTAPKLEQEVLSPRSCPTSGQPETTVSLSNEQASNIDLADEASAANLWHILGDKHGCRLTEDSEGGGVPLQPVENHSTIPQELDGHELPYVHLNSLVGHSNEAADHRLASSPQLHDSAMYLPELFTQITPALPTVPRKNPIVKTTSSLVDDTPVGEEMPNSASQFHTEQRLFEASAKPLPASRAESPCDLATLLSMGHVENFWCCECGEMPELVNAEELTDDDGWVDWSTGDQELNFETRSSPVEPQPATVVEVTDDEEEELWRHPCVSASDWEDWFPSAPRAQNDPDVFPGYYDDGFAFEHDYEDDWEWGC